MGFVLWFLSLQIDRGNRECRIEAARRLFTSNRPFVESLYTFLLYYFETATGESCVACRGAGLPSCPPR